MRIPGRPTGTDVLLELDLTRGLVDGPPGTPLQALRSRGVPALRDITEGLRKAADDPQVVGLVAHIGPTPSLTLAHSGELHAAVTDFRRRSGKPTVCWSESFGELVPGNVGVHLATAFEEIWLQPVGEVGLTGVVAEAVFLRGALDKLGVQPQFGQRHEYKTAADTFMQTGMSDAHREMADRLAHSATSTIVEAVAEGRGLSVEAVRAAVDEAPIPAERAVELGLVNRLGYRADVMTAVRERVGADARLRYVERYGKGVGGEVKIRARTVLRSLTGGQPAVAVIHAVGPIVLGRSTASPLAASGSVGSDTLGAALRAAADDDGIHAVVLRVDSPGGSYVASDAIRNEVLALRDRGKPVVASMGTVAASGGYYIAMPADEVLASAGTITGSIGVLAGKAVLTEALEKVGIVRDSASEGRFAEMFSSQRPFTDEEWDRLNRWLDEVYADFTAKAAADRGMDVEDLRSLAKGRVWTGADAAANGLVDRLGGLEDAIVAACTRAELDRADVTVRPLPHAPLLQRLLPAESSDHPAAAALRLAPVGMTGVVPQLLGAAAAGIWSPAGSSATAVAPGVLSMPAIWHLR